MALLENDLNTINGIIYFHNFGGMALAREEKSYKPLIEELKRSVEEKLGDVRKLVDWVKEKKTAYLENSMLLALAVAFAIGLAIGVAMSKGKKE